MNGVPVTGNPITDTMTKIFDWLGEQTDQVLPRRPAPPVLAPANMTD
jgi:hypothetical protein